MKSTRSIAWVLPLLLLGGCDGGDGPAGKTLDELPGEVITPDRPVQLGDHFAPPPSDPEVAMAYADREAAALGLTRHTFAEVLMGTSVVVTVYADDAALAERASGAAFDEMRRLESVMSDYPESYPDSEVLLLARAAHDAPGEPRPVSDDLWPVLLRAKQVHAATGGAFDITARPYTGLWRISRERGVLPPAEALAEHAPLVGMEHLVLDEDAQTAYLDVPGAWLDLGGIAKGYIADRGLGVLRGHGLPAAQVRAGGDMALGDAPPGLPGWPVDVPDFPPPEQDETNSGEAAAASGGGLASGGALASGGGLAFYHADGGVSVSGDAYRFVEIDGVRYSHVVDPRTGLGVTGSRYCCVKGPSAFATDAAATAGCILDSEGFEQALAALGEIEGPLEGWRFQGQAEAEPEAP